MNFKATKSFARTLVALLVAALMCVSMLVPAFADDEGDLPEGISLFKPSAESGYVVSQGYIIGIKDETTLAEFAAAFPGQTISVMSYKSGVLTDNDFVGTGATVVLLDGEDVLDIATVVVYGDLDGDGIIAVKDYVALKRLYLRTLVLDMPFLQAARVDGVKELSTKSYVMLKRNYLGTYEIDDVEHQIFDIPIPDPIEPEPSNIFVDFTAGVELTKLSNGDTDLIPLPVKLSAAGTIGELAQAINLKADIGDDSLPIDVFSDEKGIYISIDKVTDGYVLIPASMLTQSGVAGSAIGAVGAIANAETLNMIFEKVLDYVGAVIAAIPEKCVEVSEKETVYTITSADLKVILTAVYDKAVEDAELKEICDTVLGAEAYETYLAQFKAAIDQLTGEEEGALVIKIGVTEDGYNIISVTIPESEEFHLIYSVSEEGKLYIEIGSGETPLLIANAEIITTEESKKFKAEIKTFSSRYDTETQKPFVLEQVYALELTLKETSFDFSFVYSADGDEMLSILGNAAWEITEDAVNYTGKVTIASGEATMVIDFKATDKADKETFEIKLTHNNVEAGSVTGDFDKTITENSIKYDGTITITIKQGEGQMTIPVDIVFEASYDETSVSVELKVSLNVGYEIEFRAYATAKISDKTELKAPEVSLDISTAEEDVMSGFQTKLMENYADFITSVNAIISMIAPAE